MALLPVEDAKSQILADIRPKEIEDVSLNAARGRVLAQDLKARRDQPPFAASAMDGYAVLASDVAKTPARLKLIGEAPAGQAFDGKVLPGQAVRIFTGGALPEGADTVIMQENTLVDGDVVIIEKSAAKGSFVRPVGLDFSRDQTVIKANTLLNARYLGLCASMNYAKVPVRRQPLVAILATGNELVAPGEDAAPDQIVASNSVALAAAVEGFGGKVLDLGIVRDDLAAIKAAVVAGKDADILVTTGGASVGDHDLVGPAFAELGIELGFWKIAMRPGKPLMFAQNGDQRILGLPGNPVSALVCAFIFVKPLVEKMLGLENPVRFGQAELTQDLRENDQRQDHLRAQLSRGEDGRLLITPFIQQDSSMQLMLAKADALIIRAPFAAPAKAGDVVSYLPIAF